MPIQRRTTGGDIEIRLWELRALQPSKPADEDETPEARDERDPYAEARQILSDEQAVLTVRRVSGADVDRWGRKLSRARGRMRGLDLKWAQETGVPKIADPDGADILMVAHREVLEECFVELTAFQSSTGGAVTTGGEAHEAMLDFLPILPLFAGQEVLRRQRPQRASACSPASE